MRYLNMFVLISIALLGIGLAKLLSHNQLMIEPGQPQNPQDAWVYLGAGVLMLINGAVSIRQSTGHVRKATGKRLEREEIQSSASAVNGE